MKPLEIIESHFKMSFEKVISELHFKKQMSLHSLAKEVGLSHSPFVKIAKHKRIKLRNKREASRLAIMRKNPINNPEAARARALTISEKYKKNPLIQEQIFADFLNRLSIKFIFQHPIDKYVIDFFIPSKNLCIEIDSTSKWGKKRRFSAEIKDKYLKSNGYRVARINKLLFKNLQSMLDILYANDII